MRPEAPDETPLPVDEFQRRLARALAETETLREIGDLCDWFRRRYPTVRERLAYARRRHREWTRLVRSTPDEPGR